MLISNLLISWYTEKKRDLPWRKTANPYFIWVSEIILQQTRVAQGIDYYKQFIARFPDIQTLALASLDEVMKIWQGLGYYNRARNLHQTARYLAEQRNGMFPESYEEIINLTGIGEYTAAAIASFAFNQPIPVIDGNVYRVISRIFGVQQKIGKAATKKTINALAKEILDPKQPGEHNQAIMEFGALQCVPKNPNCSTCPLANQCFALTHNSVRHFPVREKKSVRKKRFFYYLVIQADGHVLVNQRKNKDIWQHLYEFPLIETRRLKTPENLYQTDEWKNLFGHKQYKIENISKVHKHQLSHQFIYARFLKISIRDLNDISSGRYLKISLHDINTLPVHRLMEQYLRNNRPSI